MDCWFLETGFCRLQTTEPILVQLEKSSVYHTQDCVTLMAWKYGAKTVYTCLSGSCIRDKHEHTSTTMISIEINQLISEAWSDEAIFKAKSYLSIRDFKSALLCLNEAVKLSCNSCYALMERARVLFCSRYFLTALKDLNYISENDPNCGETQFLRQNVITCLTPKHAKKYEKSKLNINGKCHGRKLKSVPNSKIIMSSKKLYLRPCYQNKYKKWCICYEILRTFKIIFGERKEMRSSITSLF